MSSNTKPLLMVGVPTNGRHSHFFTNFLMGTQYPTNFSMLYRTVPKYEVGDARNILVQTAIDEGVKYLFFIDEDVFGPAHGVRQLLYRLETHPEWTVAGGLYCTKTFPPEPLIFTEWGQGPCWDFKVGELKRVKATGAGFHLFRVSDLAALKEPRYYEILSPFTNKPMKVREWFKTGKDYTTDPTGASTLEAHTEDSWLYRMLDEAGHQVWIDTSILCQHYDEANELLFSLPVQDNNIAVKPDPWNRTPRVIDLGAGNIYDPYAVKVDLRDSPMIDFKCDIRKLPEDWANTFDVARAWHVLEHFGYGETEGVLREWVRILKPGGKLELRVPDLQCAAENILAGADDVYLQGLIFGDQGHPFWNTPPYGGEEEGKFIPHSYGHNHHKSGFTAKSLGKLLQQIGLVNLSGERREYEIYMTGHKPEAVTVDEPAAPTAE